MAKLYTGKFGHQWICDFCGEVVHGQVKAKEVHNRYIQIKGPVSIHDWDAELKQSVFCYVTPKSDKIEMTFCDPAVKPCFSDYIIQQEHARRKKREELLREEATLNNLMYGENVEYGGVHPKVYRKKYD